MIPAAPAHELQESHYRWRGALVACALNAIGMPLDIFVGRDVPGMPKWPSLMSAAAGLLLAVVLLVRRRHPTYRLCAAVFLLNNAVILVALWITSGVYAAAPGKWVPFQANKLGVLAVAVLSPGLVTGLVMIVGFAGMAVIRYLMLSAELQQRLPIGEPWVILIYSIFAVAILGYRVHSVALARRMFRLRTESIATQQLACRDWLIDLRAQAEALSEVRGYDWLVVQFRIGQIEAILAWLDICTTTVIPSLA